MPKLLTLLAILLLSGCTSLTSLFFYPQHIWISTPEDASLSYQDIWLKAQDGTALHAWWLPAQGEVSDSQMMVLFLHGNAENISSHARSVYWLSRQGVSVLALDYRGFGASEGQAVLPDVLQDINAAAQWLVTHYPDKKLVIVGQSIGAALAVDFIAQYGQHYRIEALVLDAPPASFGEVARYAVTRNWLGYVVWPFTWLLPRQYDALKHTEYLSMPTLIMHSPNDKVVPYAQGQKLFQALLQQGAPVCWLDSQGGHVMSFAYRELRQKTLTFLHTKRCP